MSKMFSDLYEKDTQKKAEEKQPEEAREEKTSKPGNQESSQEDGQQVKREDTKPAETTPSPTPPPAEARPTLKSSYLYTEEEFEMFEDMKLALRRKYDIQAYKNDLARAAIRILKEDFQENGDKSFVVSRFYRRKT